MVLIYNAENVLEISARTGRFRLNVQTTSCVGKTSKDQAGVRPASWDALGKSVKIAFWDLVLAVTTRASSNPIQSHVIRASTTSVQEQAVAMTCNSKFGPGTAVARLRVVRVCQSWAIGNKIQTAKIRLCVRSNQMTSPFVLLVSMSAMRESASPVCQTPVLVVLVTVNSKKQV